MESQAASTSRSEFRVWGENLDGVAARFQSLSPPGPVRESLEVYLVAATTVEVNVKVRADLLDVKTLNAFIDGMEQWTPRTKTDFPVSAEFLAGQLFPLWKLQPPVLARPAYSLEQLIDDVVSPHPDLAAIDVTKRRSAYTVNGCIAEVAEVGLNGRMLQTAAIESVDLSALREAVVMGGLGDFVNTSYPRLIHRLLGMNSSAETSEGSLGDSHWA